MNDPEYFRLCSSCKSPLAFGQTYYACNVSTCNRKRTALYFCSVACWEAHLPGMRHRSAWAEEQRAPGKDSYLREQAEEREKQAARDAADKRAVELAGDGEVPHEILIVVSKLKKYIKARSGMNTADSAVSKLSDIVRAACDEAIREAGRDDRRTVMDRDFGEDD